MCMGRTLKDVSTLFRSFFFLCVLSFTGRKSKHRKNKDEPIAKSDEISPDRTSEHVHPREPHLLQEISESPWVYPQSSSRSDDPALPDDDRYLFQHKKRGFAVLIINSKFDYQPERPNADLDRYSMSKMFQQLDFTVILLENLTSRSLLEKMIGMGFFKVKICFSLLLIAVKFK